MKRGKADPFRQVETIQIRGKPGEPEREVFARATLSPVMKAAVTINRFKSVGAEFDVADLIVVLDRHVSKTLKDTNLEEAQRMLAGQAHTLDAIFNHFALQAARNIERNHANVELFLKLALKAQSQSRANWLALSEIRNPKLTTVVNQANIAAGHQQVNNYLGGSEIAPNELLEENHERMDFGASAAAIKKHSTLETVAAINRPKKRRRKKPIIG